MAVALEGSYLHLWYLCDCEHATDEEAGQDIVMHKVSSHPYFYLNTHKRLHVMPVSINFCCIVLTSCREIASHEPKDTLTKSYLDAL